MIYKWQLCIEARGSLVLVYLAQRSLTLRSHQSNIRNTVDPIEADRTSRHMYLHRPGPGPGIAKNLP
jgi:hypothetical protein